MDPVTTRVIVRDQNGNTLATVEVDVDPKRMVPMAVRARQSDNPGIIVLTLELLEGEDDVSDAGEMPEMGDDDA